MQEERMQSPKGKDDRKIVLSGACTLALAMGIGRFAYTPILPMMRRHAHLGEGGASILATSNYIGYLGGAIAATAIHALGRRSWSLRINALILISTLALMPLTTNLVAWLVLRTTAGFSSALIFLVASNTVLERINAVRAHLAGWAYAGVGGGIALSGLMSVSIGAAGSWRFAWMIAAGMCVALLPAAWYLGGAPAADSVPLQQSQSRAPLAERTATGALLLAYTLEGAGYIIAGTFLVAAVTKASTAATGSWSWVIAGLAAVPSCYLWARLANRTSRLRLVIIALLIQSAGIALPALSASALAALISAALFGATFMGITTLVLGHGRDQGNPRAVAMLSAGYALGQVLGPLLITPFLASGYRVPLFIAGSLVFLAAVITAIPARYYQARSLRSGAVSS